VGFPAGSWIPDHLEGPPFGHTVRFELLGLPFQVVLLVVTGDPGVGDGQIGFDIPLTEQTIHVVIPGATLALAIRCQFTCMLPLAERLYRDAEQPCRFTDFDEPGHNMAYHQISAD